jgi:hypothetical protein
VKIQTVRHLYSLKHLYRVRNQRWIHGYYTTKVEAKQVCAQLKSEDPDEYWWWDVTALDWKKEK